jgi:hypothetical protein
MDTTESKRMGVDGIKNVWKYRDRFFEELSAKDDVGHNHYPSNTNSILTLMAFELHKIRCLLEESKGSFMED